LKVVKRINKRSRLLKEIWNTCDFIVFTFVWINRWNYGWKKRHKCGRN
jgi:hypothetical protein